MESLKSLYNKRLESKRITNYGIYDDLFSGNHFSAFSIKSEDFKKDYARLRYVVCNFAGLVSKVIADMLFGEQVQILADQNQDFIDSLIFEQRLHTLFYENAIRNSYFGDNLFKIRTEPLDDNPKKGKLLVEDASPMLYFPELDQDNVRAKPKRIHILHTYELDGDVYLLQEIHEPPKVILQAGKVTKKGEKIEEMKIEAYNQLFGTDYEEEVDTGIDRFLVKHIPNWKDGGHFGISDYKDLKPLLFALNNRMTKIDNILDKHSDPILAVPEGVLDEEGKVKKEAFSMFEMGDEGQVPEYIIWNANLESAFKQIDKMVEFLFMFSETSPDVLGMAKGGQAESGRALKLRLLRTIAKRNRKKLYYDNAIKDLLFTAELLAAEKGYVIGKDFQNVKPKTPELPQIKWEDGVVNDEVERTELAIQQVNSELLSQKQAIMDLHGVDEKQAETMIEEIKEEGKGADFSSFVDEKGGDRPPVNEPDEE